MRLNRWLAAADPSPSEHAQHHERLRQLCVALEQLSEPHCEAIQLHYLQGMRHAEVATGDSGMVFRTQDTQHNRLVAVKVLTPDPTHSEEQKERFVRAMKTMLPVKHPHIVQLHNAGKHGPYCWAAMEYIDGESMTQVIRRIGVEGMLTGGKRIVWRSILVGHCRKRIRGKSFIAMLRLPIFFAANMIASACWAT